jgi:amphi-Trp domain-containing protein
MSKKEVKLKGVMDCNQVIAYMEDLLAGLKNGKICVQQGEQFVTLCPEQMIEMEVQATVKKGKEKFEMELTWRREEAPSEMTDMRISSTESEVPHDEAQELPAVSGPAIELQGVVEEKSRDETVPEVSSQKPVAEEVKTKAGKKTK